MHILNKLRIYEKKYSVLDIIKFELLLLKCKRNIKNINEYVNNL